MEIRLFKDIQRRVTNKVKPKPQKLSLNLFNDSFGPEVTSSNRPEVKQVLYSIELYQQQYASESDLKDNDICERMKLYAMKAMSHYVYGDIMDELINVKREIAIENNVGAFDKLNEIIDAIDRGY